MALGPALPKSVPGIEEGAMEWLVQCRWTIQKQEKKLVLH